MNIKTTIKDISGKEHPALYVFSNSIAYLMGHLHRHLKDKGIVESDIKWVLTVPALWDVPEKKFMMAAAEEVYLYLLEIKM